MKESIMNQQMVHYKIYMCVSGEEPEIRHFIVDKIVLANYHYLTQKLITLFPLLKNVPFTVHWKDREGDSIQISTDDEILIALSEMASDSYKKIYVKVAKQQENKGLLHPGIICDECYQPVQGFRYKCLVCYDYELCAECEKSQVHRQHIMIRISKPLTSDKLFMKRLAKEMPIISKIFERLCMQNTENNDHPYGLRTSQNENKKQSQKVCTSKETHDLVSDMLYKTLRVSSNYYASKAEPLVYSPGATSRSNEQITVNLGTDNYNDLPDELKSLTPRTGFLSGKAINNSHGSYETQQFASEEQDTIRNGESFRATSTRSPLSISEALYTQESTLFQMDAAPVPSDPTPVLQAQLTPPITDECPTPVPSTSADAGPPADGTTLTLVPLSRLLAPVNENCFLNPYYPGLPPYIGSENPRIPVFVAPPSPQDDEDSSWTLVNNEMRNSIYSSPPVPVASLTDPALRLPDFNGQDSERLYPDLDVSQLDDSRDATEDAMTRLQLLGFANEEWLRTIVENKKGNVREVLRFLSPITKPSTNSIL